jgi:hypothetical protein
MTESDARDVLLVRAFESARTSAWTDADALRAGDEAHRAVGASASFEAWLASRARFAVTRLAERDAALSAALHATGWSAWIPVAAVLVAFVAGFASDAIGPDQRINILAPPLLALLLWNILVYSVLLLGVPATRPAEYSPGPLRRALLALVMRVRRWNDSEARGDDKGALVDFAAAWAGASRALYGARIAATLHAAAVALVLGALLSLYVRGLAFEYRAGWESTFLSAANVHALITTVLGPAAHLSGIALPDVDQLAALRFTAGSGENAARWIHLYALTFALVVLVPRCVLAFVAALRAWNLARRFPLPLDDAYFVRLRRGWSGTPVTVQVLPYSYHLHEAQRGPLITALRMIVAPRSEMTIRDTLPLGAEDDLSRWVGGPTVPPADEGTHRVFVALFALSATPEREQHGAFVRALRTQQGKERVFVLVDESGFRQRFAGGELAQRLEQRHHAWRSVLGDEQIEPFFVDLSEATAAQPPATGTVTPT